MATNKRPVIICSHRSVMCFDSVGIAARTLHISKQRLLKGLESEDGLIPGTRGVYFIDDQIPEGCKNPAQQLNISISLEPRGE